MVSSLNQGQNFQKITASYHGGKRKTKSKSKMTKRRGSSRTKTRRTRRNRMRGGSSSFFTPYSDYPTSLNQMLPTEIRDLARVAPLDAKFAELPAIERAAGVHMSGGRRRGTKRRRGGASPLNAPSMLLANPEEESAARLNPQWYTENTVIPNFRGPVPISGTPTVAPVKGGRRNRRRLSMRR